MVTPVLSKEDLALMEEERQYINENKLLGKDIYIDCFFGANKKIDVDNYMKNEY